MQNVIQQSPIYLAETKNKGTKFLILYISMNNSSRYLSTETWITKSDGEESIHKYSGLTEVYGKNIGRSNETTVEQQAVIEYNALLQKKIDAGYHLEGVCSDTYLLPQLANKFDIIKFNNYPVVLQPKLDGVRALLTKDKIYSRAGKDFITQLFDKFTMPLLDGIYLDGELMLPEGYTFQETISAVKKYSDLTDKLEYHVYDLYDANNPNLTFNDRYNLSRHDLAGLFDHIKLVPIQIVFDKDQFLKMHSQYISDGYEGTMVRENKQYTPNHRSKHLMKYKDFMDAEFLITDVVSGNGKYFDCGVFICATVGGGHFNVILADTIEKKQHILKHADQYIGKYLTVKFQEYTDGGIPRFPVGVTVRDFDIQG